MKTWKRILTLTLSAIMVAGLAACGGGGGQCQQLCRQ